MPLSSIQSEILRLLSTHRNPESYVAGSVPLNREGRRYSDDIDIFHDREESVAAAAEADAALLAKEGFVVRWLRREPGIYGAIVARGGEQMKLEWVRDSDFRFFPTVPDDMFGSVLHVVDIATNKALAAAGRREPRDVLDLLTVHDQHLPLGAVIWAAVAKDPGYSPESLIGEIRRNARYLQDDYSDLALTEPVDARAVAQRIRAALDEAERPPPRPLAVIIGNFQRYAGARSQFRAMRWRNGERGLSRHRGGGERIHGCGHEACARIGHCQPARLEGVAGKKEPCDRKGIGKVRRGRCARFLISVQESGQAQELVGPGAPGLARDRASALGRNVDQVLGRAGCGAAVEVEAEAELGEHAELEARHARAGKPHIAERIDEVIEHRVDLRMRVAFRQEAAQGGGVGETIERRRGIEEPRRSEIKPLHRKVAEMLVEPGPPGQADPIARLQHRAQPRARRPAHEAKVAAMLAGHRLENGASLPVALDAQHDGFIDPLHERS